MKAIICDVKGCEKVIKGGPFNDFAKEGDGWAVSVALDSEVDRCEPCSKKLFAKVLKSSWDDVKRKTKTKVKNGKPNMPKL
jgi:hypothetical protein